MVKIKTFYTEGSTREVIERTDEEVNEFLSGFWSDQIISVTPQLFPNRDGLTFLDYAVVVVYKTSN